MLKLDEALFDDDMVTVESSENFFNDDLDDSVFIYEPLADATLSTDHNGEAIPEGPKMGVESGIADSLIKLINDEWEAIQGYNTFREMILSMEANNDGDYTEMLRVIDEVVNEENLHVGQLQELLKKVSPNTESIAKGEEEAEEQLEPSGNEWVNGRLKVEFHEPRAVENSSDTYNAVDSECTLCDADDEW